MKSEKKIHLVSKEKTDRTRLHVILGLVVIHILYKMFL